MQNEASPLTSLLASDSYLIANPMEYFCKADWSIEDRVTPDYHFWFAVKGRGKLVWNDKVHPIRPGSFFFFRPGDRIEAEHFPPDCLTVYACHFTPARLEFWESMSWQVVTHRVSTRLLPLFRDTARWLKKVRHPQHEPCLRKSIFLLSVFEILTDKKILRVGESFANPRRLKLLDRCRDHAANHLNEKVTVAGLAELTGVDRSTILRLFKEVLRTTPHAWLSKLRLEKSREDLVAGESVAETARKRGYPDPAVFSRSFKAVYGMPPSEFQKKIRDDLSA